MHLTCIKMEPVLAFLKFIQEGLPLKIRAAHILNTNYIFYRALNLFKRFIGTEILKLVLLSEFIKTCFYTIEFFGYRFIHILQI